MTKAESFPMILFDLNQSRVYTFLISNSGQSSALKVAYISKVLGAQSCLKPLSVRNTVIFRIENQYLWSVISRFPKNAFEAAEFSCIVGLTAILRSTQRKNSLLLQSLVFVVTW